MSDDARIVVRVAADGTVTATTHDILGQECLDYVTVLEDLLGARTVRSAFTEDHLRTALTGIQDVHDRERRIQRLGQDGGTDRPDPAGA
jgi:hypothetical protein